MKNYIYSLMTDRAQGPGAAVMKFCLWICSLIYGVIVAVTRSLYAIGILPAYRSPKPVISVGNLTVGGSGKTPLVIWLASMLKERRIKPAILIRGYMRAGGSPNGDPARGSDEAQMLTEILPDVPLMVSRNRGASIKTCLASHAVDLFVCDDGFQHWPLQRDLDIVAIDASNPFGNGHLVPRGILREPLSALRRAHIFVLTKTDQIVRAGGCPNEAPDRPQQQGVDGDDKLPHGGMGAVRTDGVVGQTGPALGLCTQLKSINPHALIVESRHVLKECREIYQQEHCPVSVLKGNSVVGFCAIGQPSSFQKLLEQAGMKVVRMFDFLDHHVYTSQDMAMIRGFCQEQGIRTLVTTHKDAVKIQDFKEFWQGYRVLNVQMAMEITQGKDEFIQRIVSISRH